MEQGDQVFAVTLKIASGRTQIPPPMVGAYVTAYLTANGPKAAVEGAFNKLRDMGYSIEDVDSKVSGIPVSQWNAFIAERWPQFRDQFPDQANLLSAIAERGAVLSPFAGFEK